MNLSLHTNTVQLCSNITIQYPWVYLAQGLMQEDLYALVWNVVTPVCMEDTPTGGVYIA